jgi:hypothetical protein
MKLGPYSNGTSQNLISYMNFSVKLPIQQHEYYAMKMYGGMEVQFHAFLTSALDTNPVPDLK